MDLPIKLPKSNDRLVMLAVIRNEEKYIGKLSRGEIYHCDVMETILPLQTPKARFELKLLSNIPKNEALNRVKLRIES